jgi:glutathione S-transferase
LATNFAVTAGVPESQLYAAYHAVIALETEAAEAASRCMMASTSIKRFLRKFTYEEASFMLATAGTLLSAAVTVLAVLLGLYTMMLVGRMRSKHGVHAPAVTGAPEFERAFRVQMNTLEQVVLFLPLLWLATIYPVVSGYLAPGLGLIWLIGRVLYSSGYMADAAKRSSGFLVAGVALLGLLVLSIVGIIHAWLVTRPG